MFGIYFQNNSVGRERIGKGIVESRWLCIDIIELGNGYI